jgi:hypothetical protein
MACTWLTKSSALDPGYKLGYVEEKWDTEYFEVGKQGFEALVSHFRSTVPHGWLTLVIIV